MAVPYTFGTATAAIPLSQLDSNFATAITIGNTAVQLGNTVTTLNNMTLANVTISSGNVTITNVAITTANVSGTANISTLVVTANASVAGNVTVTGNTVVTGNVTSATHILTGGTANGVVYLDTTKVLTTGSALVFDGTNLGVGVTPSAWYSTYKALQIASQGAISSDTVSNGALEITNNSYRNSAATPTYINSYAATLYTQYRGEHRWYNAASGTAGNAISFTQAMTLNASGNYFLGTTTNGINTSRASIFNDSSNNTATFAAQSGTAASTANMVCYHGSASGATAATQIAFLNGAASQVGSITSTGSVTAFNPSSDKRLKDNIQSMTDGLNRVMKLKPVTFVWKENGEVDDGFIAQDLQETTEFKHRVNPIGERNGEMYYGVDYMRFVSVLTAAIQEQQALITQLTARITTLESA